MTLHDTGLYYSTFWTLHLQRCVDVRVRGMTIRSHRGRINADGIDPDGCRDVRISDCLIETCDDAVCLKSTEGDRCENITVNNCILSSRCAAVPQPARNPYRFVGSHLRQVTVENLIIIDRHSDELPAGAVWLGNSADVTIRGRCELKTSAALSLTAFENCSDCRAEITAC